MLKRRHSRVVISGFKPWLRKMLWWQQSSNNVSSKMWNGSWGFLGIKSDRRCPAGSEGAAWRHQKSGSLFRQQANHRYVHILEQVLTSGRRLKSKQTNKIEQRYACKNMCPKWKVVWCEQNLVVFFFCLFFWGGGNPISFFLQGLIPRKNRQKVYFPMSSGLLWCHEHNGHFLGV